MSEISKSYDEIYKTYAKKLYIYAMSLTSNTYDAEDLVQTTFLKAIRTADRYRGECNVFTWLCRIARNTWLDECRKKKSNISLDELCELGQETVQIVDTKVNIEEAFLRKEDNERAYSCLHEMQEPYKEVFRMRSFGELSFKNIGEMFEKSETWARVTYFRAKKMLIDKMKEDGV